MPHCLLLITFQVLTENELLCCVFKLQLQKLYLKQYCTEQFQISFFYFENHVHLVNAFSFFVMLAFSAGILLLILKPDHQIFLVRLVPCKSIYVLIFPENITIFISSFVEIQLQVRGSFSLWSDYGNSSNLPSTAVIIFTKNKKRFIFHENITSFI